MTIMRFTPHSVLAYARAFACLSAAKIDQPTSVQLERLVKLLDQEMYRCYPVLNTVTDCRPYILTRRTNDQVVAYVPSWARAGVRYARPGINIEELDPRDWYHSWYDIYYATFPDIDQNSFEHKQFLQMFECLADKEDEIRELIDKKRLITKPEQIRRLPIIKLTGAEG